MNSRQRALALWQAFITFYMTLTAGATLTAIVGARVGGILALIGAAMNAGTTTYLATLTPPETVPGARDAAA